MKSHDNQWFAQYQNFCAPILRFRHVPTLRSD